MTGVSVASQARGAFSKVQKSDEEKDHSSFWDIVDLGAMDALSDQAQHEIYIVMQDSANEGLGQLEINDEGLVNQVDRASVDYAKERSAEMIGKKLVDGELVDNPDAQWVITDSTRDSIRALVEKVLRNEIPATDLPQLLMQDFAFSKARAQVIARTELMEANAQGSLASYRAARETGLKIKKAWHPDANACPICEANADAGPIELDDLFPSGDPCPTAHPNCECVLVPVVEEDDTESEDSGD